MPPKLQIVGVGKSYPGRSGAVMVLDDISLSLGDSEFVSLLGPSGCGKSSLLSLVAGLQDVDHGAILVDGAPITGPGLDRGVVFQSYSLLPWLTASGNIEFALRAAGHKRAEAKDIAREHLRLVQLERNAASYPHQLSGGMRQRVAIARALSYRPKILLLDEPFGALDALTRQDMQALLTRIWEQHRLTVLFVTHDVDEAVFLSDRVVVMRPGRIHSIIAVDLPRPRQPEMLAGTDAVRDGIPPPTSENQN
jgi:NitT/TauT family transport system ATP-binding protein